MSWLGGSISSLTGQLSNFTKEVLSEGTEEVSDHATELSIAQHKTQGLEAQCLSQKQELKRVHAMTRELEERAHSAELQVHTVTKEYRRLLQEKEKEIRSLQQRHQEMQDLQAQSMFTGSGAGLPSPGYHSSHSGFTASEEQLDFGDVISSQHEINRLSDTVRRLQAEREHWKQSASHAGTTNLAFGSDATSTADSAGVQEDSKVLQSKVKNLELKLHRIVDEHQNELTTLQDLYTDKLSDIKRKHEKEVTVLHERLECFSYTTNSGENNEDEQIVYLGQECSKLQARVLELQLQQDELEKSNREKERTLLLLSRQLEKLQAEKSEIDHSFNASASEIASLQETISALQLSRDSDKIKLENALKTIKKQETFIATLRPSDNSSVDQLKPKLEAAEAKIAELLNDREQVCCDLYATKHRLLAQLDSSHADNSEMLLEIQLARHKFASDAESRQAQVFKEKQELVNRMAELGEMDKNLQQALKITETNVKTVSSEAKEMIEQLGDPEHQQLVLGMIHALELENKILKQQNTSLQSQMQIYRKLIDATDVPASKLSKYEDNQPEEGVSSLRTDSDKTLEEFKLADMECYGMPSNKTRTPGHKKAGSGSNFSEPSESTNQSLFEFDDCETSSLTSTYSELSLRNKELDDQVKVLQSQIESHERDIEHFEIVKSDWQMEKKALEEILSKLRTQLRAKEASLTLVTAQRGLLEVRKQTPRTSKENVSEPASPELNFEQELEKLQEQIEELAVGSSRLENERDILLLEKDKILEELHKMNLLNQELRVKLVTIEKDVTEANRTDDVKKQDALHARVMALEEEVANLSEEKNALILSLEELDQQHQIAIEKILESRNLLLQKGKDAVNELESLKEQLEIQQRSNIEMEAKLTQRQEEHTALSEANILKQKDFELSNVVQATESSAVIFQSELTTLREAIAKVTQEKDLSNGVVQIAIKQVFQHLGKDSSIVHTSDDPHELLNALEELFHTLQDLERSVDRLQSDRCEIIRSESIESTKCKEELRKEIEDERTRSLWEVESWEEIVDDVEKGDKEVLGKTKLQDLELESTSSKQSKDSSEDSHEKYGELVQRKEDLEIQVKELETQLATLQTEKQLYCENDASLEKNTTHCPENSLELRIVALEQEVQVKDESLIQVQIELKEKCEVNEHLQRELELTKCAQSQSMLNPTTNVECSASSTGLRNEVTEDLSKSEDIPAKINDERMIASIINSNNEHELLRKVSEFEADDKEMKAQLSELRSQNVFLSNAKLEMDSIVMGLQNDLLNYEKSLSELNTQNKQLLQELKSYKDNKNSKEGGTQGVTSKLELQKDGDKVQNEKLLETSVFLTEIKDSENLEIQLEKIKHTKDGEIHKLTQELKVLKNRVQEHELNANVSLKSVSEEHLRTLQREKEQIMSVLNEKSRENSSLKAEVHRLMNVVCVEKATVSQLQQGNQEYLQKTSKPSVESTEMTKEAVQNLSRIIRDKDVEIEALNQKNQTLVAVLQQSSSEGTHLQSILQEKENLMKQLSIYQGEREQLIVAVNQKHHESMSYHAEIQRLSSILSTETHKMVQLQQQHSAIARQYEDKQKTLLNTQNELISLKQRVSELEEQHMDLKMKCAELRNEQNRSHTVKVVPSSEGSSQQEEVENVSKSIHGKDELLFEKDKLLREYQQQIQHLQEDLCRKVEELSVSKRQADNLNVQLSSFQSEIGNYKREYEIARQRLDEGCSEVTMMKDTNNRLSMAIQERDFELQAVREKVETLTSLLQQRSETDFNVDSSPEMKRLLQEGEEMQRKAQQFQHERDQVMLALSQRQQENKEVTNALRATREREERLQHELERLRNHMLQVEESYTQEALHAEEREKDLRTRLVQAEEKARNASSSFSNASYQANLQVESLQEQLHTIAHQRDSALLKMDSTEDQVQQLTASLQTLQVVLEQFQQEKERELTSLRGQFENVLRSERQKSADLQQQIQSLEHRLIEAADALDAASRLSEQLDNKETTIVALKQEVTHLESSLRNAHDETTRAASSNEGKVDRSIIKNLLVNYFSISQRQKPQVLRIIATVLDFNQEERIKTGLENTSGGWISSWLGRSPTQSAARKDQMEEISAVNQSLSAAFIQFLQEESRPYVAIKLPAESMAQELAKKSEQQRTVNPFAAPSAPVVLQWPGTEAVSSSHLLMKPMLTTLPTFTPMPISNQSNVLRDVLKRD